MVYFRDNALYSADADGTEPRRFASLDKVKGTPWRPEVSPDGKRIAFSSFLNDTNNNNSVFEIGSDGSDLREIPIPTPDDSQCCAVWMPDGKSILTTAGRGISGDIWLQPANSGLSPLRRPNRPHRLTNGELSYRFAIVRPSRDGSRFSRSAQSGGENSSAMTSSRRALCPFSPALRRRTSHSRATGVGSVISRIRTTPFGGVVRMEPIGCN